MINIRIPNTRRIVHVPVAYTKAEFPSSLTRTTNASESFDSKLNAMFTNKTLEMIAMKIFKFVEVATQSHHHEETRGYLKVLRGERGH